MNSYKACYRSDWPNWSRRGPTIFSIFAKDGISLIQKLSKYCFTREQRATDGLEKQRKKNTEQQQQNRSLLYAAL